MSCIANARLYGFTYQVASMPTVGECIGFWVDAAPPFTRIKTSPHRTHQDSQGGEMSKALRLGKDVSEVSKKKSLALLTMLKILMVNRTFQNHAKCCRTPPLGKLVVIVPIPSLANQVGHATIYFLWLVDGWMTDELVWTSTYCIWWPWKYIMKSCPLSLASCFNATWPKTAIWSTWSHWVDQCAPWIGLQEALQVPQRSLGYVLWTSADKRVTSPLIQRWGKLGADSSKGQDNPQVHQKSMNRRHG